MLQNNSRYPTNQIFFPRQRTFSEYRLQHGMEWDPMQFFRPNRPSISFAILVLNQPINERAFTAISAYGE